MSQVKNSQSLPRISVLGAGGLGVNIASVYNGGVETDGSAFLRPSFIDTSLSNMRAEFNKEDVFLIPELDGSGKQRDLNIDPIRKHVKAIIQQLKPEKTVILVFSFSGGSGSVIGPLLARELLQNGHQVIVVGAGSEESSKTAKNTLDTIKSLIGISQNLQTPLLAYYDHNTGPQLDPETGRTTPPRPRSEVDQSLRHTIAALAFLYSGQNNELDSQDLINWQRFDKSTSAPAQLALLDIYKNQEDMADVTDPIAIASLYKSPDQAGLSIVPDYHCAGYVGDRTEAFREMHFVISTSDLPKIMARHQRVVDELKARADARVASAPLLSKDELTNDGMVI